LEVDCENGKQLGHFPRTRFLRRCTLTSFQFFAIFIAIVKDRKFHIREQNNLHVRPNGLVEEGGKSDGVKCERDLLY
jgi:hypothetical protein